MLCPTTTGVLIFFIIIISSLNGKFSILFLLLHLIIGCLLHPKRWQGNLFGLKLEGGHNPFIAIFIILTLNLDLRDLLILHEHADETLVEFEVVTLLSDGVQHLIVLALMLILDVM